LAVYHSEELYLLALNIQVDFKYSFYDSLMLAAAIKSNCPHFYSEDLQQGQFIDHIEIINPISKI